MRTPDVKKKLWQEIGWWGGCGLQFFTRIFVVGERVTLQGVGGGTVVEGVVERIDPMRTLLRTDAGMPVALPNSSITGLMVVNQSRLRTASEGIFRVRAPNPKP
jgi:small-conductance mechanosensitive channel